MRLFFFLFRTERGKAPELTGGIVPQPSADPLTLTDKELAGLRKKVRSLFEAWAGMATFWERLKETGFYTKLNAKRDRPLRNLSFSSKFPTEFEVERVESDPRGYLVVKGDIETVFLYQLSLLLLQGGASKVRVCLECQEKLFVKSGRKRYCSTRCLHRANKRAQRSGTTTPRKKAGRKK